MIRNPAKFAQWLPAMFDGEFDWDFMIDAFHPTKIQPMDGDGMVERYGRVIIFETKEDGKSVPLGQAILLTTLWKKNITIMQIAGKTPSTITGYQIYLETDNHKTGRIGDRQLIPGDAADVVYEVRCWFCWASGLPIPERKAWDRQWWGIDNERSNHRKTVTK